MKVFLLDLASAFMMSIIDLSFPVVVGLVIDDYIPNNNLKMIIVLGVALLIGYIIRARFSYYVTYNGHIMGAYIQRDMRRDLFKKYEELDYEFYDDFQTGVLMSYITNHLRDISEMAHHVPEDLFISGTMFIIGFIYLSTINLLLTSIIFVIIIFIIIFSWNRRKKMMNAQRQVRQKHGELNAKIENSISGIRLTKAYNNEDYEVDKFQEVNENYAESTKEAYKQMGIFHVGNEFLLAFLSLSLIIVGGVFVYYKLIEVNDLLVYYIFITLLTRPIGRFVFMIQQFQQGVSGFEKFYQIMQIDPKIKSKEGAIELVDPKGEIEFDNVSFTYNNGETHVIKNFNIKIKPGEKIGLIGETGVGKSTISKLIPRFYDVNSGSIKIDGTDIKDFDIYSLRKSIGHVQQDVFIFYGTIQDNILYGNPDATLEDVIDAAKKANIHDFIDSLPDGYQSYTGEKGVKLSGGQKQRIAIARLFLKKPKIVVLDEATSALDNVTERLIQSAFDDLIKDKTAIVIAHRLSTIQNSDRIIVLGDDGILEMGSHEELVKKEGVYYRLLQE
jgi:ATP-binding cassette subfamily B protein